MNPDTGSAFAKLVRDEMADCAARARRSTGGTHDGLTEEEWAAMSRRQHSVYHAYRRTGAVLPAGSVAAAAQDLRGAADG